MIENASERITQHNIKHITYKSQIDKHDGTPQSPYPNGQRDRRSYPWKSQNNPPNPRTKNPTPDLEQNSIDIRRRPWQNIHEREREREREWMNECNFFLETAVVYGSSILSIWWCVFCLFLFMIFFVFIFAVSLWYLYLWLSNMSSVEAFSWIFWIAR